MIGYERVAEKESYKERSMLGIPLRDKIWNEA